MTNTTQATDVVAWLRGVLKEHERLLRGLECDCDWVGAQHPEPGCPAFVLADIAAKRAIVDEHAPRVTEYVDAPDEQSCGRCGTWHEYPVAYPCRTLRLLASAYAHRDGYREEWRP